MKLKLNRSSVTIIASLVGVGALAVALLPLIFPPKAEPTADTSTASAEVASGPSTSGQSTLGQNASGQSTSGKNASGQSGSGQFASLPPLSFAPTLPATIAVPAPDFLYETWTITDGNGDDGNNWSNSTIEFTTRYRTNDGWAFGGAIEWRRNGELLWNEFFEGRFIAADRTVYFGGPSVQSPTRDPRSCSCRLSDDGRKLLDGKWGTPVADFPGPAFFGVWTARR